jgi:hypothetical protein
MADENTMDSGVPLGPNGLRRVIIGPDGKALPDVPIAAQPETGLTGAVDKLFGINGQERYQTWPEKMVREAVTAPGEAMAEGLPRPGLRREDFTNTPVNSEPQTLFGKVFNAGPVAWSPEDNAIEKAQAVSALSGTGMLAAEKGALGSAGGALKTPKPEWMKEILAKSDSRKTLAAELASSGKSAKLFGDDGTYALAGPDMSKDGVFRLTRFDKDGPSGHTEHSTLAEAIDEGLRNKYNPVLNADNKVGTGIGAIAASEQAPRFFSAIEKQVASAQPKMSGDQWLSTLGNKPGVKPDEMQYTGLNDFLAGKKSVTREEIQQHLEGNKLELGEVVKGARPALRPEEQIKLNDLEKRFADGDKTLNYNDSMDLAELRMSAKQQEMASNPSKYSQYQLPGGKNYREMLMTLPEKKVSASVLEARAKNHVESIEKGAWEKATPEEKTEWVQSFKELNERGITAPKDNYRSSHWDEPNILAHMRMNDRTIDGKNALHLEEVQSDWHQEGRKKGYRGQIKVEGEVIYDPTGNAEYPYKIMVDGEIVNRTRFKESANSELQTELDRLQKRGVPDAPFKKNWHELALKRAIAEAAENGYDRLSWTAGGDHPTNPKNLGQTGEQADAADRGMRGFYDSILPKSVEKLTGQKVQKGELSVSTTLKDKNAFRVYARENGHANATDAQIDRMWMTEDNLAKKFMKTEQTKSIHYIDIPQSLRESIVGKGQPLFSAPPMLTPVDHDPFKFTPVEGDPFNPITNKDAA